MVSTSRFPHFYPLGQWAAQPPSKAREEEPPEAPEGLVTDETEEKESDRVKAQPSFRAGCGSAEFHAVGG